MQPPTRPLLLELDRQSLRTHAAELADWYAHHGEPPDQSPPYRVRVHARTQAGRAARLQCRQWWARQLNRRQREQREYLRLCSQTIGADTHRYASSQAVAEDRDRRKRTLEWAARQAIQGPNGARHRLLPLLENATERRYAELTAWTRGLDDYATAAGLVPILVTLTLPPEWHPNPSQGRSSWNRASPRSAAAELSRRWDTLSRAIRRHLSEWCALRVREPHADGCPHDHLVAYVHPDEIETLRALVAEHFPGRGGQVEQITDAKGSTYACKYIAKHTQGTDQDEDGEADPTEAVRAYRTVWGIRTFAFLGLPRGARTLYRLMRQIPGDLDHPADQGLQQAAKAGQVRRFLELYKQAAPAVLTEEHTDRYGDPVRYARGIITSDGEPLELPRYEIVPAEDQSPAPSYDEWAKGAPQPEDGTRDPGG